MNSRAITAIGACVGLGAATAALARWDNGIAGEIASDVTGIPRSKDDNRRSKKWADKSPAEQNVAVRDCIGSCLVLITMVAFVLFLGWLMPATPVYEPLRSAVARGDLNHTRIALSHGDDPRDVIEVAPRITAGDYVVGCSTCEAFDNSSDVGIVEFIFFLPFMLFELVLFTLPSLLLSMCFFAKEAAEHVDFSAHATPLVCHAAQRGRVEIVRELLSAGANPDSYVSLRGGGGSHSALSLAAASGHTDTVSALINAGAAVDWYPGWFSGDTPLGYAVSGGHESTAALLACAGASLDGVFGTVSIEDVAAENGIDISLLRQAAANSAESGCSKLDGDPPEPGPTLSTAPSEIAEL